LIGDEAWDVAVVTRYPSRRALAELVRDPEFEATTPLRHAALEAGILHAFAYRFSRLDPTGDHIDPPSVAVHETLVAKGAYWRPRPLLAESWTVSDDGL